MNLEEQKAKISLKLDEKKANHEKRKTNSKIKREEKKVELKAKFTSKKIESHIEKAIKKVYKAEDDADEDIFKLLEAVDAEIEAGEKPVEFIVYETNNKFAEIVFNTQLKIQKAKNELIKNLAKDIENVEELINMEEDLAVFEDEMDEVTTLLDEKIDIEKETEKLD